MYTSNKPLFSKSTFCTIHKAFFLSPTTPEWGGGLGVRMRQGVGCEIFFSEYCAFCCATICFCLHCVLVISYLSTIFGIPPLFRLPSSFKGTVSRAFASGFFHESVSPQPQSIPLRSFRKFAEIFASQGAPPVSTTTVAQLPLVSMTPAANFSTIFTSVVDDIGGKFAISVKDAGGGGRQIATGINDTGGKFATVNDNSGKQWE
jgi:hypothetical protein